MMKYCCLLIIFLIQLIDAQITIKEDISTDSVNLFTTYEQNTKNAKLAMAASLLLPGAGHQYLGRPNAALTYLSIDIFALVGAIFCEQYSRKLESDSRGYAAIYSGAHGSKKDNDYWQAVGDYDDFKSYNMTMELNREFNKRYTSESMSWSWADSSFRKEYSDMRKNARICHIVSASFFGVMVLNRIVSIVDIRASSRFKTLKNVSSVKLEPTISSDFSSAGLMLTAQF